MVPDRVLVERQIERLEQSADFKQAWQMRRLLRYLVESSYDDDGKAIKGYSIGVDVFGRPPDFDPSTDSIVRVQVARLRRLLTLYYLTEGSSDPVRIEIPKGSYKPQITLLGEGAGEPEAAADDASVAEPSGQTPAFEQKVAHDQVSVVVLPVEAVGQGDGLTGLASGIAESLAERLAKYPAFLVREASADEAADQFEGQPAQNTNYLVSSSLHRSGDVVRLRVRLTSAPDQVVIWSSQYEEAMNDPFIFQDELAGLISPDIQMRIYRAEQARAGLTKAEEMTPFQLYVKAHFRSDEQRYSLKSETELRDLARQLLERYPQSARVHAVFGLRTAIVASFNPFSDTDDAWAQVSSHIERAVELAPLDTDVLTVFAMASYFAGDVETALWASRRMLMIDPDNLPAKLGTIAAMHILKPIPPSAIAEIKGIGDGLDADSYLRFHVQHWLCLFLLMNEDFDEVIEYGLSFPRACVLPQVRLALCAALDQTGDFQAARQHLDELRQDWPTIDLSHIEQKTIPRLFGNGEAVPRIGGYIRELADREAKLRVLGQQLSRC